MSWKYLGGGIINGKHAGNVRYWKCLGDTVIRGMSGYYLGECLDHHAALPVSMCSSYDLCHPG